MSTYLVNKFYLEFGLNLRRQRLRPGTELSQDGLAKRVGMSRTSITNIEQGRQQVPLHMLYTFADALGVDPSVLLPDRRRLETDERRVIVDLNKVPAEVAQFLDRIAARDKA